MKKWMYVISAAAALSLAACSGGEKAEEAEKATAKKAQTETAQADQTAKEQEHKHENGEPHDQTTCAFCEMKVYTMDEEMGQFTAKATSEDGETLFFDDVGCMLNYERKTEKPAKERFVRDFNSLEWIPFEQAKIQKTDVKTPMNYGYAFFQDEASEQEFTKAHAEAKPASVEDIDAIAKERYMKKMNMSDEKMDHDGQDHGHEESEQGEHGHSS
ncbi:nitrous oxide reductase accessory protein NosL [Pseudobacillus badius]|uniref:nitrous oxide reductase accessory protein NosL n=1 Tax=Bacillus badius TaxID=1455 RepID=UPI003CE981FB